MKTFFGFLFALAIIYLSYTSFYLGFFKSVEVKPRHTASFKMIYQEHVGPYHEILESIEEIEKYLGEQNIPCNRSFGQFLDDPNTVAQERLRSHVGCLVYSKIDSKFQYKELPARSYAYAKFDGSPAIGPYKVYPKVEETIQSNKLEKDGPVLEVYTRHSDDKMSTEYLFPIKE